MCQKCHKSLSKGGLREYQIKEAKEIFLTRQVPITKTGVTNNFKVSLLGQPGMPTLGQQLDDWWCMWEIFTKCNSHRNNSFVIELETK